MYCEYLPPLYVKSFSTAVDLSVDLILLLTDFDYITSKSSGACNSLIRTY